MVLQARLEDGANGELAQPGLGQLAARHRRHQQGERISHGHAQLLGHLAAHDDGLRLARARHRPPPALGTRFGADRCAHGTGSSGSISGCRTARARRLQLGIGCGRVTAWTAATGRLDSRVAARVIGAESLTGADSASSRERSSDSKPFITERMTISAATPTATPSSDTQVMKETKNRCARAPE
ncbi:MAG: hypothetical protein IPG49_00205 [Proteobacteria bacterium]|nr:hypothetical protein [Pseudomonadota bacterium]